MNRKKGIIIGTTGIIIVTLALIGFTYGFYLSLISGNETSKKVKVTAGKSKLEYVELSTEVDIIIGPGYTNTKYFAVQNVGDISASYYLYLVDVENTFNRKNDIVYTIYRKAYDYSEENVEPEEFDINGTYDFSSWENITNTYCKTVSEFTDYGDCQYPSEKSQLSTQKQTIMDKNDYYVYAFVVTYINQPEIDQIDDEESVFSGKVKIYADETGTDVSPFEAGTLADAIYINSLYNKNGTSYSDSPLTKPAIEISSISNYKTSGEESLVTESMLVSPSSSILVWYYYDSYEVDAITGKFTLSGKHSCKLSDCYGDLIGKYLYSDSSSNNTSENNHIEDIKGNLDKIYKVNEVALSSNTLYYSIIYNIPNEAERVLTTTEDDYGTSYYYRGSVYDNYLNFAGMCWRVIRIAGDNSIKIILEDQYATCEDNETITTTNKNIGNWVIGVGNYGYDSSTKSNSGSILYKQNYLNPVTNNASSMVKVFYDFQTTKLKDYSDNLKGGDWCFENSFYDTSSADLNAATPLTSNAINSNYLSDTSFYSNAYIRLYGNSIKSPSLKCHGTIINEYESVENVSEKKPMYVGTITADEVVFAGGVAGIGNEHYYLINIYQKFKSFNFRTLTFTHFRKSAAITGDRVFALERYGNLNYDEYVTGASQAFRPVVSLVPNTKFISGEGTKSNPYVVE